MNVPHVGYMAADGVLRERMAKDGCHMRAAAQRLLDEGFSSWVWPDCMTSEQEAEAARAAQLHLKNLSGRR